MIEFIDKTLVDEGTPFNRANMMAMQGFIARTTTMNADGSITEVNDKGETLTTVFGDGIVTETFVGKKTIIKTTTFNTASNTVTEVLK